MCDAARASERSRQTGPSRARWLERRPRSWRPRRVALLKLRSSGERGDCLVGSPHRLRASPRRSKSRTRISSASASVVKRCVTLDLVRVRDRHRCDHGQLGRFAARPIAVALTRQPESDLTQTYGRSLRLFSRAAGEKRQRRVMPTGRSMHVQEQPTRERRDRPARGRPPHRRFGRDRCCRATAASSRCGARSSASLNDARQNTMPAAWRASTRSSTT